MKKTLLFLLCTALLCVGVNAQTLPEDSFNLHCASAVLMERSTGTLLWEKNSREHLSPASVTKVMTMLLVAEAVDNGSVRLSDTVRASTSAAAMGGSQVYLKEGEEMTVGELLKCVAVASANDCAVALAELLCGSESAFAARMNARAEELGLADTHFSNCTGLPCRGEHYSCARDIAVMSRELLSHAWIREYTTIWTDSIRGGEFGLNNTNKLVHAYPGCTGLKTGFTSEAMFCLAASAEREGVEYVAVILHGDSSADRFAAARTLLDYAFANYTVVSVTSGEPIAPLKVELGMEDWVQPVTGGEKRVLTEKAKLSALRTVVELPESVRAPVEEGQTLGLLRLLCGEEELACVPLKAERAVERRSYGRIWHSLLDELLGAGAKAEREA